MKYLHKYNADGKTIYMISEKTSKPSGTVILKQEDWRGRALGKYNIILNQLEALSFTRKEKIEQPEEEKIEQPVEEVIEKKAVASEIRKFALNLRNC